MSEIQELINNQIKNRFLKGLYTSLPAKIINVNSYQSFQTVDVKPMVGCIDTDGVEIVPQVIYNIPVIMMGGNGALISIPLAADDTVLLIFTMRDISRWKKGDGSYTVPDSSRLHDINDAIAIPGLFPKNKSPNPDPQDLVVKFNESEIRIKANGDISVNAGSGKLALGNSSAEVIAIIEEILQKLEATTTSTSLGPQPFINVADFTTIRTSKVQPLKGTL